MADRSSAAVGETRGGPHAPQPGHETGSAADIGDHRVSHRARDDAEAAKTDARPAKRPPRSTEPSPDIDLHSGHKLAKRYRLEECVTRLDGFSSWRAVDEKLRRAVGVHILPADHERAETVLAAARAAALLGDPHFVHVLDAVEIDGLAYVVHEWLPDATPLSELLTTGPLPAHEAYLLVSQLSRALAAAHQAGLSHLQLNPTTVLRSGAGQYRIRGLAVSAALRGVTSAHPKRTDTEAIGALLYACLTQRWPYEEDAYGLSGLGDLANGPLLPPDQVRAGVHRGLSELALRALVNDGATASREEQPCTTPEELAAAVAALPRIRPPEQHYAAPGYEPNTHRPTAYGRARPPGTPGNDHGAIASGSATPPTLPGRTGKALKWGVSALLIAALALGSWQVSESLLDRDPPTDNNPTQPQAGEGEGAGAQPIRIVAAKDFDPEGDGSENPDTVQRAFDGDEQSFWYTRNYYGDARFGRLKRGAGLVLDLGRKQSVRQVRVHFDGRTSAELLAAPGSVGAIPETYDAFRKTAQNTGTQLAYDAGNKPLTTRYLLVWLTELPQATDGNYRGRITEIQVSG